MADLGDLRCRLLLQLPVAQAAFGAAMAAIAEGAAPKSMALAVAAASRGAVQGAMAAAVDEQACRG
eukprot:7225607-Prorocentrum_lima.AAC.1